MYACIYELRKNCCGWTGGESKVLQEVLADLKKAFIRTSRHLNIKHPQNYCDSVTDSYIRFIFGLPFQKAESSFYLGAVFFPQTSPTMIEKKGSSRKQQKAWTAMSQ